VQVYFKPCKSLSSGTKSVRRSAFSVQRSAFGVQRSAFSVQRSAFGVRRSAFSVQRSAFSVPAFRRSAFGVQRSAFSVQRSAFLRSCVPAFGVRRSAWQALPHRRGAISYPVRHCHESTPTILAPGDPPPPGASRFAMSCSVNPYGSPWIRPFFGRWLR
jgi:hypothetical protein